MKITHIDIWKYSIPMHPFTIATGTMDFAQNLFIRIHTDQGFYGVGECSAFPMIVGETQATCFEMAKDFAKLWKDKNAENLFERLDELDRYTAFNSTAKSAFDMALYDLAAKKSGLPLYKYLNGSSRTLETDITIGIDSAENMAAKAMQFVNDGARILKIKVGKNAVDDVHRVEAIRKAVGESVRLRIDANQGWSYEDAVFALNAMEAFDIEFCEQPMRSWNDHQLPALRRAVVLPIMADESVFNAHDAERLIREDACSFINIKFSKSGGLREALKIHEICKNSSMFCMIGGMLESRLALSASAHFALACENVVFYDMDTCLVGHKTDPVLGGIRYEGFMIQVPETPGIGADVEDNFLAACEKITI